MVENFIENVSEELTLKLKLRRMSWYQSGKKSMSILSKERNSINKDREPSNSMPWRGNQ